VNKINGDLFKEANKTSALIFTIISTTILCFFIVFNANWILGDDVVFLETTAVGKFISIRGFILPEIGRFLPFQLWDYNILRLLNSDSALAHYSLVSVSLVFFSVTTFLLYKGVISEFPFSTLKYWLIAFTTIFLSTRVYSIFLQLHFAERITVVLLSIFLYFYYRFHLTEKWIFGALSVSVAMYIVYCKEPMFGALLTIPLTHFVFNYKNLTSKSKIVNLALIANSILFISLYYFWIYLNTTTLYHVGDQLSTFGLITKVFRSHKLLLFAVFLSIIRIYFIVIKKDRDHLFIDGLLFAGVVYTVEVLVTGLHYSYYFFPAVLFCLPSLIYWSLKMISFKWLTGIMLVCSLYCSYLIIDDIKASQQTRLTTYPKVLSVAKLVSNGYEISWLAPSTPEGDPYSQMIAQWKMGCFHAYLNYIIYKSSGKEIDKISYIKNIESKEKNLIIFPEEYRSITDKIELYNSANQKNTYSFFNDVGGIIVYKN